MRANTVRTLAAAVAGCLLSLAWVRTSTADKDPRLAPEVLHGPSLQPDRVILTWAGDPATTQAVTWRTSTAVARAAAQIAVAEERHRLRGQCFRTEDVTTPSSW
jgi:hypothetical protein